MILDAHDATPNVTWDPMWLAEYGHSSKHWNGPQRTSNMVSVLTHSCTRTARTNFKEKLVATNIYSGHFLKVLLHKVHFGPVRRQTRPRIQETATLRVAFRSACFSLGIGLVQKGRKHRLEFRTLISKPVCPLVICKATQNSPRLASCNTRMGRSPFCKQALNELPASSVQACSSCSLLQGFHHR